MGRAAQELQAKHLEPLRVAIILDPPTVEVNMAAEYPLVVVMEEVLPLEGLMDHQLVEDLMDPPTLGDFPLELQEDHMAVQPQEAPMDSHLQVPMVASIPGLTDRDPLQVALLPTWILRLTPGSSQWTRTTVATSPSRS